MAFCRVSYRDINDIEHAAEVTASSLYEAVALGIARFRRGDEWNMSPPGANCEVCVRVLPESPIRYSIPLKKVETFALCGIATGPKEALLKQRLRELLGVTP